MESIRYQEIVDFSRGQIEFSFDKTAVVKWCGLNILCGLTPSDVARQFSVAPIDAVRYPQALRCRLGALAGALTEAEVAALGANVSFQLPEVTSTNLHSRFTGSLAFEKTAGLPKGSFRLQVNCVGQDFDAAILLCPAEPLSRQRFDQKLQLASGPIGSKAGERDSRNCPLWIIFQDQTKPKPKRFFGLW